MVSPSLSLLCDSLCDGKSTYAYGGPSTLRKKLLFSTLPIRGLLAIGSALQNANEQHLNWNCPQGVLSPMYFQKSGAPNVWRVTFCLAFRFALLSCHTIWPSLWYFFDVQGWISTRIHLMYCIDQKLLCLKRFGSLDSCCTCDAVNLKLQS